MNFKKGLTKIELAVALGIGVSLAACLSPTQGFSKTWEPFKQEFLVGNLTNLTANSLFGVVSEAEEETPGAYVHYNIDDDNLNDLPDKDESTQVSGENDLVNAAMKLLPMAEGIVKLKRDGSSVNVWKSALKGQGNDVLVSSNEKAWDLSDSLQRADFNTLSSSLYVEGAGIGAGGLTLEYNNGKGLVNSDRIKYTFIAATCGRQPTKEERADYNAIFPALVGCEWSVTGAVDGTYNCIAWSVGETNVWYNPISNETVSGKIIIGIDETYGNPPNGVFDLADMDKFYEAKGYVPALGANDADVLYYSGFHGARKKGCSCGAGKWIMFESKCGEGLRIEHVWSQMNGTTYGAPVKCYKRK